MMNKVKWVGIFAMPNMLIWTLSLISNAVMVNAGVYLNRNALPAMHNLLVRKKVTV